MSGDTFDFVQGGVVTSSAQLNDNAATVGDVLTVQADKSIAATPGGGSQPVTVVRFPFTFATPGLATTGVVCYTPTAGDIVMPGSFCKVTTPFNGTTPQLTTGPQGFDPNSEDFWALDADGDDPYGASNWFKANGQLGDPIYVTDTTPMVLLLWDGNGGDPGSTAGVGEVVLLVIPAP